MSDSYQPIDCDFHDLLETLATTRRRAVLEYRDDDGAPQRRDAVVVDVFARDGAEYLVLDDGLRLRLDRLLAVNGLQAPPPPAD
jgi:Rho-binding antiterminator